MTEDTIIVAGSGRLRLPRLGLGTWPMTGEGCRDSVLSALALGYRHIDTAERYENEDAIGAALSQTDVSRGDLHLTSKVWWDHLAPAAMRDSMARSLDALRTDYVDLYLIHWPNPESDLGAALDALAGLQEAGLARAVGVANFPLALLRRAVEQHQAPIACLQVEYHAMLGQAALHDYARAHDIALTAYSPLGRGLVAQSPVVAGIAAQLDATAEQVALAWLIGQDGVTAVPKAAGRTNQLSNLRALDVRLTQAQRAAIDAVPKDRRVVSPDFAPAWDAA